MSSIRAEGEPVFEEPARSDSSGVRQAMKGVETRERVDANMKATMSDARPLLPIYNQFTKNMKARMMAERFVIREDIADLKAQRDEINAKLDDGEAALRMLDVGMQEEGRGQSS